jgi:uncharacterized protein (PEP-CTERM system associated)
MAERVRLPVTGPLSLALAAPTAILAVLLAPQARAEWKVVPAVDLRETYSDNLRLEANNTSHGQFITELSPSLSIANNGPRLKLSAAISEHFYAYSGERVDGTNSSSRSLLADARAKLIEDLLFLDAAASISQQSISAFGPQVYNNGYASANRGEVRTYSISPYLVHQFGAFASTQARYTHNSVSSGNAGFGDSKADDLSFSIASGTTFRTLSWGLQASRQELDDSLARKSSSQLASANLRLRVGPELTLNASAGYDKYDYSSLGGTTAGKNHALGFSWTPSLRTSIQASAGKRYFGSTYSLIAMHRSRRTVWNVNYNDGVTTTRDQFLLPATIDTAGLLDRLFTPNIPDPAARQQAVDAYIRATGLPASLADNINYFSNRYILQKQLQASAGFNTARSTTVVSLNTTKRNALSSQQVDSTLLGSNLSSLNDDTRQKSAAVSMSYRLSPRSSVNLALSRSRTESLSTGIKGNQTALSLAMTQQFNRRLKGALELRRNQGNASATAARNYRENAISASLSLQL